MILSKKAQQISSSLTLSITAKAKELRKQGIDVIGFGAGEPDFNTPNHICKAAVEAIEKGLTKYTPASGIIELKDAIVNKLKKENNLYYNTSQIIISNGAKQCLSNIFQAILNPEDEVIISSPYWVSYPELVKLYGGKPVFVTTEEKNNFKYTIDTIKKAASNRTKAILVNSPNNPTGTVYTKEELKEIAEFAKEKDILIISDEIYEKLIYSEIEHISIASISEDTFNRTIVVNGMSKAFAMTGWRIGYAASANEEIIKVMSNIQGHTTSNPNSIAQYASVEALVNSAEEMNEMISEFKSRRDYMVEKINKIKDLSCVKPEGAFYVMVNISKIINKKSDDVVIKNSLDFTEVLLDKAKVAVIPGAAFGVDEYIRLSYATSMDNIKRGLDRIEEFILSLQ